MTDGGFAKRTRTGDYRLTNRGTKGVKAMTLANEERGVLVGAFIVEDGDEVLSITQSGQVVRSPINENFRPMGRSTQGVKFVSPKSGDSVAVVARSVEAPVDDEVEDDDTGPGEPASNGIGPASGPDATIEESGASEAPDQAPDEAAPQED